MVKRPPLPALRADTLLCRLCPEASEEKLKWLLSGGGASSKAPLGSWGERDAKDSRVVTGKEGVRRLESICGVTKRCVPSRGRFESVSIGGENGGVIALSVKLPLCSAELERAFSLLLWAIISSRRLATTFSICVAIACLHSSCCSELRHFKVKYS